MRYVLRSTTNYNGQSIFVWGAATSTIGLTVPAVIGIGLVTGQLVVLEIDNTSAVLLATTLLLSVLTFCGARTTVLECAVHLVMFGVYIVLIFSP